MRLSELQRRLGERGIVISTRALAERCKSGEIEATRNGNMWDVAESELDTIRPNRKRPPKNGYRPAYDPVAFFIRRYGVDPNRYEAMWAAFEGRCPICLSAHDEAHVDHCHDSGRVRGLLCRHCNHGLGNFRDNPDALRRAADYLETGLHYAPEDDWGIFKESASQSLTSPSG